MSHLENKPYRHNCARLLAAVAPFALGNLAQAFADPRHLAPGFRTAGVVAFVGFIGIAIAPETKGKPLPQ